MPRGRIVARWTARPPTASNTHPNGGGGAEINPLVCFSKTEPRVARNSPAG